MFKSFIVLLLVSLSARVFAETPLQNQIDSVYDAQERQNRDEQAAWNAQQLAIQQENSRRSALERARANSAVAVQNEKAAAASADKTRNQSYEDQLRDLNIQKLKLELQTAKSRADRENDFIDQDLQRRAASTDVIHSEADANRNVSSGIKNYLDQSGQAEVKRQSKP